MKRYKVNLGLHLSARNRKEAYLIVRDIIEKSSTVTPDGRWVGITLGDYDPKTVEKLPF